MYRKLPIVGAVLSLAIMLGIAAKWEILRRSVVGAAAVIAATAALPFWRFSRVYRSSFAATAGLFGQVGLTLALAVAGVMQRFWRDPERVSPPGQGLVLSPADGEVVYVRKVPAGATFVSKQGRDYRLDELIGTNLMDCNTCVIGVGMTTLDVHVNRAPIAGQVQLVKHIGGGFMSLKRAEAPFENERATTILQGPDLDVAIVQVASRLVRRIETYFHEGQTVMAGQRLGMIRFGSLVAVVLPEREDMQVQVSAGDRVQAGVSVLARYAVTARAAL